MEGSNALATPAATSQSPSSRDSACDPVLYRQVVGSLQYLGITRPEIAFAVGRASRYMHAPSPANWSNVKRILRYLQGTRTYGLLMRPSCSHTLSGYSDADWASCPEDRRSTTGYGVYLGPNLISWSSRKQRSVSRSFTEAEYRALATVASEVIWLQSLLREIHLPCSTTPVLWCDNLGATYLSANPVFHARSKHMEIDFHFVRELVAAGNLHVQYISGRDQIADILTKPLPRPHFEELRSKLTVTDLSLAGE